MAYKECQSCGKKVHPNTKTCKYCGSNPDKPKDMPKIVKEEVTKDVSIPNVSSVYKNTRMMAQAASFAGLLVFTFSITGFVMAFVEKGMASSLKIFGPLLGVVGGIIIIILSQLTRALVDVADHCSEMLTALKSKPPK
jgi:hypothetical protein